MRLSVYRTPAIDAPASKQAMSNTEPVPFANPPVSACGLCKRGVLLGCCKGGAMQLVFSILRGITGVNRSRAVDSQAHSARRCETHLAGGAGGGGETASSRNLSAVSPIVPALSENITTPTAAMNATTMQVPKVPPPSLVTFDSVPPCVPAARLRNGSEPVSGRSASSSCIRNLEKSLDSTVSNISLSLSRHLCRYPLSLCWSNSRATL